MRSTTSKRPSQPAGAAPTTRSAKSRRRKWLSWSLVITALGAFAAATAEELSARLSEVTGYVLIQRNEVYLPTESPMDLKPGDTVIVMEKSKARITQGTCTLSLAEGSVYTVKAFPTCQAADASVVRVEPSFLPAAKRPPGSLVVDVAAAERALERTLTEQGALLLPQGYAEVTPSLAYTHRELTSPTYAVIGGRYLVLANADTKRDEGLANLNLKIGLPWTSQLEIGVPYNFVKQSSVVDLGTQGRITGSQSASGFGDVQIGLAKQLLREKGLLPDVVLRLTYGTGSGQKAVNNVSLNSGYPTLGGQLTLLKRQDPLAFVANLFYTKEYESDNVQPGDEFGFSIGAVLAASPNTSLQFAFADTISHDTRINGVSIPQSGTNQGLLTLGASSVLGKGVLLNFSVGVGLTKDAPDYVVQLSLPIRFSL